MNKAAYPEDSGNDAYRDGTTSSRWALWPWQENVVEVDNFGQLSSPTVLNTVIADMCPEIPIGPGLPPVA